MGLTIKTTTYINDFTAILSMISDAEESKERYDLCIERENNCIKRLTEQEIKIKAEIAELKEEFEDKFIVMFSTSSKSIQTSLFYSLMNLYINFYGKNYYLFDDGLKFSGEPEEILSSIASIIAENLSNVTFNKIVKELSDLYAKYVVNPEFIKNQMLKIYNKRKINELNQYIESCRFNISVSNSSLESIKYKLADTILTPTLFNKIFHKKQLALQSQKERLLTNIDYWEREIESSEQKVAEIKANPEKNIEHVEAEIKALKEFLDVFELINTTKEKIRFKESNISDLNQKIHAKKSWINDYEKDKENQEYRIQSAHIKMANLCERLSEDQLSFNEIVEHSDNETIKQLLEHYESYITNSLEQAL